MFLVWCILKARDFNFFTFSIDTYSYIRVQIKYITNLFNDFKKGRRVSEKIFGLYFFESWRQKYKLN